MEDRKPTAMDYRKSLVLQHDQSDCGVACLRSVIRHHGGDETLDNLRRLSGTSKEGTSLLGLQQAATKLHLAAEGLEGSIEDLKGCDFPMILHVITTEKLEHYVVCYAYSNNYFTIGNPSKGIESYSAEDLEKVWSGKCLSLQPKTDFISTSEVKKSKQKWFWNLLKPDFPVLRFSIILGIVTAVLGMSLSVFSQKLVDDILPSKDLDKLIGGIGLLFILLLCRVFLSALRSYFLIYQTKEFNVRIIDKFFSTLLRLPRVFFDTRKIGDLVARLNDTSRIQRVIVQVLGSSIIDGISVLISFVFLFFYSTQVGLIALVSVPIYFAIVYRYNKTILVGQRSIMENYAHSESNYISSMSGINEIKNLNKQELFNHINQQIYGTFQQSVYLLGRVKLSLGLWSGIAGVIFITLILSYSAYKVWSGSMDLGVLFALLGITGGLIPAISNLALLAIPLNEGKIAFDRMYELTSIDQEKSGLQKIKLIDEIRVKNIVFRFPGSKPIINGLSFTIQSKGITAIVGESGSGKSTLTAVLQKEYQIESGEILINGQYFIDEVLLKSWRKYIAIVPQEITLFRGNLIDNIILGDKTTPESIRLFLDKYGFTSYFEKFPNGFNTMLGDDGTNISAGQKQLVAFARALYSKPKFLIVDEGTSAMDIKTEAFILKLLQKLKKKIPIIYITHRVYSLTDGFADQIIRL